MYKRKIIFLVSSILVVFVLITATFLKQDNKVILSERGSNIINSNAITMMYETEANSGEYQVASESTWPQEGYTFNETLSSCENGSALT